MMKNEFRDMMPTSEEFYANQALGDTPPAPPKELKHMKKVMTPFGVMENHSYKPEVIVL
jgi:hypothetical protein